LGEKQIVALVDVHGGHDGLILNLVGVCVNRIGKIHTFTTRHIPLYFPIRLVAIFRILPFIVRALRWTLTPFPNSWIYNWLVRIENFHRAGSRQSQENVFKEVLHYYPDTTRFVVLPMAMEGIGHGPVTDILRQEHDDLANLWRMEKYRDRILPFVTINSAMPGALDEFQRCVDMGFVALKLYPQRGYEPSHELLTKKIYPICRERELSVISHCSRGGVFRKGWDWDQRDKVSRPDAFVPVMDEFLDLRVCLAHFGGDSEWRDYLTDGVDPDDPDGRKKNWVTRIVDLIGSGKYDNLYTDVSYTIFKFAS